MGVLIYGARSHYDVDDRTLAHLRAAIGSKLRRRESFFVEWTKDAAQGGGRVALWITGDVPLQFRFAQPEPPIDQAWVRALLESSYTPGGMILTPEPGASVG
jgi:hypothetical protein